MYTSNSLNRGYLEGRPSSKPYRKSGRRTATLRVLRPCKAHFPSVSFWESNPEYSDTSMDQNVVQDLLNAVAALESGEESDVRRQLSTLAVFSGGESDCKRKGGIPLRRKMLRQKARNLKKKRRPKRRLLCVHSADESAALNENAAAIAHPRLENHLAVPNPGAGRAGPAVGQTSSEDDNSTAALRQLQLFLSDDNSSSAAGVRRGDSEVSSSVCVTESELSDTAWEESCDADDELSCFESSATRGGSLRAAVASAARAASKHCYGDVEDAYEVDEGASDLDGRHSLLASSDMDAAQCLASVVLSPAIPGVSVSPPAGSHSVTAANAPSACSAIRSSARPHTGSSRSSASVAAAALARAPREVSKLTSSTSSIGGNERSAAQVADGWSRPASAGTTATGGATNGTSATYSAWQADAPAMSPAVAGGLRTLNRILFQFATGRRPSLPLPAMHRRSRRLVWRLASLYQLEWVADDSTRGYGAQYSVLMRTRNTCIPDATLVDQFIRDAMQVLSKPARSSGILERLPVGAGSPSLSFGNRRSLGLNLQEPVESEEMEADETSATDAGDHAPQHGAVVVMRPA